MVKKFIVKYWWALGLGVLLIAFGSFTTWAYTPPAPMPEALAALNSDAVVTVVNENWLEFQPAGQPAKAGFVFYPGGRVDYRSYAPAAHAIAAEGFLVIIPPVPFNLAFFSANVANNVIAAHPEVTVWVVGGHSLGGVAAAQFVSGNPGAVQGLAFWASYPAGDMSASDIKVISISGTQDGLSTPAKIEASRAQLPADTIWVAIDGGNHAQFGWYGPQAGDNLASITREEQQTQIVAAMTEFLAALAH